MKLLFTDAKTGKKVFVIDVIKDGDNFRSELSPIVSTFQAEVSQALYILEEGFTDGQCDDDDEANPYLYWVLLNDCCEVEQVGEDNTKAGWVVRFVDGDFITHDEHFDTYTEIEDACVDYIKADLFHVVSINF